MHDTYNERKIHSEWPECAFFFWRAGSNASSSFASLNLICVCFDVLCKSYMDFWLVLATAYEHVKTTSFPKNEIHNTVIQHICTRMSHCFHCSLFSNQPHSNARVWDLRCQGPTKVFSLWIWAKWVKRKWSIQVNVSVGENKFRSRKWNSNVDIFETKRIDRNSPRIRTLVGPQTQVNSNTLVCISFSRRFAFFCAHFNACCCSFA